MELTPIIDKVWKDEPVSDPELSVLLRWLLSVEGRHEYEDMLQREWEGFRTDRRRDYSRVLERINHELDAKAKARKKPVLRLIGRVAAVVVPVALAVGVALYFTGRPTTTVQSIARFESDPVLIMPDGAKIVLGSGNDNDRVAEHDRVAFVRENGRLINRKRSDVEQTVAEVKWGSLEVPKGALFDMVLEDGTQVWLNADSRLRFPIEFSGDERRVILDGEAYFDVARNDSMPFVVETPQKQSIRVLGTEFNVYAYGDGAGEHTTLVRGSVSVRTADNGLPVDLRPGQQATLSPDRKGLLVKDVGTADHTAWRDGVFAFDGNTLKEVFVKMARWYDIEHSFEDENLAALTLSGTIPRSDDIGQILNVIGSVTDVKIKIEGRRVTIGRR